MWLDRNGPQDWLRLVPNIAVRVPGLYFLIGVMVNMRLVMVMVMVILVMVILVMVILVMVILVMVKLECTMGPPLIAFRSIENNK